MTVASGIAYAAVRLSTDLQKGIISRFRTMPVAPSSVLSGQAVSSTLSNLFSCVLVIAVAVLVGFRPVVDVAAWLLFAALLILFTLATTWLAMFFGLLAKTVEGAGAFSYILLLLIFISPSFVPTDSMTPVLRSFAEHQPMTPIIDTMRSLLTDGTPGPDFAAAVALGRRHPRRLLRRLAAHLSPPAPRSRSPRRPATVRGGQARPSTTPVTTAVGIRAARAS